MKTSVKIGMIMIAMMLAVSVWSPMLAYTDSSNKIQKIEQFIEEQRNISKIPGISVVIVEKGKTIYQQGFGYADLKTKQPVTGETRFEIGSTSKAFTGLAILQLEKEGLLKRTDDVQKYIPWLKLNYNGELQTITLNQLLHHTSGISFNSITFIPESNVDNALELTVKTLVGQKLNRKPGSSMEYATINYDVLGLVIEAVTKKPYDQYIKQQILEPIGMKDSFVGRHQVQSAEVATGYKIGFMKAQAYEAPIYRGNIPAGYLISNTNDISKWMNVQLGNDPSNAVDKQIVQESHIPDQSVVPFDQDTYYASGWVVQIKEDKPYIFHEGENPNFSSYIILHPDEQVGVAILSNMNTTFTKAIGQGVMNLWEGNVVHSQHTSIYQNIDIVLTIICIAVGCVGAFFTLLTVRILRKLNKKQRMWTLLSLKKILSLLLHTLIVTATWTTVIMLPKILLGGLPWSFIKVWSPTSITVFFYIILVSSSIYYIYGLLLVFTTKTKLSYS